MANRLDKERESELTPKRAQFARNILNHLKLEIISDKDSEIQFMFKGEVVRLFPYSGWHTGKSIIDGRGIENLIKQIK
jgi:hypothetical protein